MKIVLFLMVYLVNLFKKLIFLYLVKVVYKQILL